MRQRVYRIATRAFVYGAFLSFLSCAGAPPVCDVSPIEIEETLSDSRDLDPQVEDIRAKLAVAQADLARWQERLSDRRAQPPRLRAELERLKKASGRTEKAPEPAATPQATTVDFRLPTGSSGQDDG